MYISGCSAIHHTGIMSSARGFKPWDSDQAGVSDIRRDQVLATPHLSFGKLCLPDKLSFSAAALALEESGKPIDENTAILLASPFGSFSTDMRYRQSVLDGFPSPALFSATLPSSPVAEIAIYFGIKGPNRVYAGGNSPWLSAIDAAQSYFDKETTGAALVICTWCIENESVANESIVPERSISPSSFALHLTSQKPSSRTCASLELGLSHSNETGEDGSAQERLLELIRATIARKPVRLPFCVKGFNGYFRVNYSGTLDQ